MNAGFFAYDGQLIAEAHKIKHIPTVIVQVRGGVSFVVVGGWWVVGVLVLVLVMMVVVVVDGDGDDNDYEVDVGGDDVVWWISL